MLGRKRVVQNEVIARRMRKFFAALTDEVRVDREEVARAYGVHLWRNTTRNLVDEKRLSRSRFYVGLSTRGGFEYLTKRAVLISDTLLLSHDWTGEYHELGVQHVVGTTEPPPYRPSGDRATMAFNRLEHERERVKAERLNNRTEMFGMHCPSLADLGQWISAAEPLLTSGLAWYLPSYSIARHTTVDGERQRSASTPEQVKAVDCLIRDGRAIDASGAEPVKSRLIRPVNLFHQAKRRSRSQYGRGRCGGPGM